MKVIFLDFDGVLNCRKYVLDNPNAGVALDPQKVALLKEIVAATGANIVLTTSWREHWQCDSIGVHIEGIFQAFGLEIFDKTPKLSAPRGKEIKAWLAHHPETEQFVVLDDMLLGGDFLHGHCIKTSYYADGLQETDVTKAIAILNG